MYLFSTIRLTAAILLAGACAAVAQTRESLTLDQAVALAIAHNYTVKKAELGAGAAADNAAAVRTERLPQFHFTALAGELLDHPTFTFDKGSLGALPGNLQVPSQTVHIAAPEKPGAIGFAQISLPLSQQYRIGLNLEKLEVARKLKQEEFRGTRADVVAAVHEAYYKLLRTQYRMETAERTVNTYKEMERVTVGYTKENTVLRSELLKVQAHRARAEYDATVLSDQLVEQREQMNILLGRPIEVEFTLRLPEEPSQAAHDLVALRDQALAASPEVKQAELRLREARIGRSIKKSEYIPDISLSAGYIAAPGIPNLLPQRIAAAGLVIDWQPFDWGRKGHELDEMSKQEQQAELALQETRDRIRIAVGSNVRKLTEAQQLLAAARINQESTEEDVRVMTVRYTQNAALLKSVMEAQASAGEASEQTFEALEEWWTAQSNLAKILGETQ